MSKTIGIISIKGGVGKTTVSSSIASSLANHFHKKVLLVDANFSAPNLGLHMDIVSPQRSIHQVLDEKSKASSAIHTKFGVDVIPGDYVYNSQIDYLKLKESLKKIKPNYDFIVLDTSPSLNDETLSAILASDHLFVVTTPDYPTLSCSLKAARLAKQRGKPISGIIINKIRDPSHELTLKEIEAATDIPVIARIPDDKTATRALFTRIPIPVYKKSSKFAREISKLNSALTNKRYRFEFLQKMLPYNFRKEEINRQFLKKDFY